MKWLVFFSTLLSLSYAVFSYSLTDPNLVLLQAEWYQHFQSTMWSTFFENPELLSWVYGVCIVAAFGLYLWGLSLFKQARTTTQESLQTFSFKHIVSKRYTFFLAGVSLLLLPLLFSYNALSHDVFNYMFNAKMVLEYDANPHQRVALDFPDDPWVRFMHNTHTPAPYGYGWTALSLVPSFLGSGIFLVTWLLFRLTSVLSVFLLYAALQYCSVQLYRRYLSHYELALLFVNPLFLIEVISNSHNDIWMMAAAVWSIGLVVHAVRLPKVAVKQVVYGLGAFAFSVSIKFATLALLPVWALILGVYGLQHSLLRKVTSRIKLPFLENGLHTLSNSLIEKRHSLIPLMSSVLLFIPLFTSRSQQFHPWYLLWSLSWIPLIKSPFWKTILIAFSCSSLLRYLSWLQSGGFDGSVLAMQKTITWVPVACIAVLYFFYTYYDGKKQKR